jgi:lysophospholipase L1-like esterase
VTRGRWIAIVVAIVLVAAGGTASAVLVARSQSASSGQPALPGSMASAGDSITRAFDLDGRHFLQDSPEESWASGNDPAVSSHYGRILAAHPAIAGKGFNDARSGAKMDALDGQLKMAAAQQVDYVTILIGANDLCTSSVATMTPAATFEAQFDQALAGFLGADRGAHVFVSSIPNLFRLWDALRTNPLAQLTWNLVHICGSLLSATATAADRQQVVAREQLDNAALASVCRRYDRCRFDNNAVFGASFAAADVSSVDYFHPSLSGQKNLAAVTWAAGYWPASPPVKR